MGLLALLVFVASIIAFFSEEFLQFFKKFFAIRGMLLIFPLLVVSGFVMAYMHEVLNALLWLQTQLRYVMLKSVNMLPFRTGAAFIVEVFYLLLIPSLFAHGVYWFAKYKHLKNELLWATRIYPFLWTFLIILWIT
jgi:hypothetical protein